MLNIALEHLAEKTWEQYWNFAMLTEIKGKLPESAVPFFKQFFKSGFIEGYRTKEEE